MCIIIIIVTSMFILLLYKAKNRKFIKNIVLVRFHIATFHQQVRYAEWRNISFSNNLFLFLTDINCNLFTSISYIYCITANEVVKQYPTLKKFNTNRKKDNNFLMWSFHIEHVIFLLKKIMRKYIFQYVWIIEQDFGYSGNINHLFKKYENNTSDLLTTNYMLDIKGWYFCCTKEYMDYRKKKLNNSGYITSENIQRWSIKYIKKVKKLLKKHLHSHSEHASIEHVFFSNLTVSNFFPDDIGYKFNYKSKISKKEWIMIMNNPHHKNKMFHALKF